MFSAKVSTTVIAGLQLHWLSLCNALVSYYCLCFISSVQWLSHVWLFTTPWITARQASLSITNSQCSLRLTSIESVMPSSHLILCRPVLLLPSIFPSIWVFSDEEIGKSKTFGGEKSKIIVLTVFVFWWGLLWVSHFVLVKYRGKREIFCSSTS